MSIIRRAVGTNIRSIRKNAGWSQEKLAIRSKVSSDYMGRLERGEVNVSIETLFRISKALRVPFSELVKGLDS
jgi:transcriptional regulator with XRE-family HTH domain